MEITIKELHTYMQLAHIGRVQHLPCPVDATHLPPISGEGDDGIYLECLECGARQTIGLETAKVIKRRLLAYVDTKC